MEFILGRMVINFVVIGNEISCADMGSINSAMVQYMKANLSMDSSMELVNYTMRLDKKMILYNTKVNGNELNLMAEGRLSIRMEMHMKGSLLMGLEEDMELMISTVLFGMRGNGKITSFMALVNSLEMGSSFSKGDLKMV